LSGEESSARNEKNCQNGDGNFHFGGGASQSTPKRKLAPSRIRDGIRPGAERFGSMYAGWLTIRPLGSA
jgi:hypothetical protein